MLLIQNRGFLLLIRELEHVTCLLMVWLRTYGKYPTAARQIMV